MVQFKTIIGDQVLAGTHKRNNQEDNMNKPFLHKFTLQD